MPPTVAAHSHESVLKLRASVRSTLARYDTLFVVERRRTLLLLALLLYSLATICVLATVLIKEDRAIGTTIAVLAACCSGLVTSLLVRQSPAKAVAYLARRDELRRLVRQLDLYTLVPDSLDARQLNEITRSILELLELVKEYRM